MKRVVSLAYFRHSASHYESDKTCSPEDVGKVFERYLPAIIRAHWAIWRGWELRIHHDDRVMEMPYWPTLEALDQCGLIKLIPMGAAHRLCMSMLWRMTPCYMSDVEYVLCRDIDYIPQPKDRRAVEEFIISGMGLHVIHDAKPHSGIMGGTLGVHVPWFQDNDVLPLNKVVTSIGDTWDKHGQDQHFLNQQLGCWSGSMMVHDLDHETGLGDLAGHCRRSVDLVSVPEIVPEVLAIGDDLSRGIGVMSQVKPALDFYKNLDIYEIQVINRIEAECASPEVLDAWPPM